MTEADWIATLNAVAGPIVIVLIGLEWAALFLKTAWTIARFGWRQVPILQWRDFLFWSTLTLLIVGSQYGRLTGTALGQQLWWVALTDLLSVAACAMFAAVEFGFIAKAAERGPVL